MFPPFSESDAEKILKVFASALDEGELEIRSVDFLRKSSGRSFGGIMLGALTCQDSSGKTSALFAVSGTTRALFKKNAGSELLEFDAGDGKGGHFFVKIVPPIVSAEKIDRALFENDRMIHELTEEIALCSDESEKSLLKKKRSALTDASLSKVFDLYAFHCADSSLRSLKEICAERKLSSLPPTGTGECCAPKLLDYAFSQGMRPLSLCEAFYRKAFPLEVKSPCDERCRIILPSILGLEILYRDDYIAVVNKESGLLSIPGRGAEKADSVTLRLKRLFPSCIEQPSVHRLDMETSGLMVLAFTKEAHRNLSRQFMEGSVRKKYLALLDGVLAKKGIKNEGCMELYFRLDTEHRPHQIWDSVYGKKALTSWRIMDVERYGSPDGKTKNVTRVEFTPHTGRTHQLRLASADSHGFGVPIIGDTLYGKCLPGERLMLHACLLEFFHPVTNERMVFTSSPPF